MRGAECCLALSLLWLLLLGARGGRRRRGRGRRMQDSLRRARANAALSEQTPAPLKPAPPLMFWRLQKVGSSSLVSLLLSHAFRFNLTPRFNARGAELCFKLQACASSLGNLTLTGIGPLAQSFESAGAWREVLAAVDSPRPDLSVYHELCALDASAVRASLPCAFSSSSAVQEVFLVREPVSRAVSVYYFWGEIFKMRRSSSDGGAVATKRAGGERQIGAAEEQEARGWFVYHGSERSAPPEHTALAFASALKYNKGMPGPSASYSAFASSPSEAAEEVRGARMLTLVLERLDESLVLLARHLRWSLADVVLAGARKALSPHPPPGQWPAAALAALDRSAAIEEERAVYEAATARLDERVRELRLSGVDVDAEVALLRSLRARVGALCQGALLEPYRALLAARPYLAPQTRNLFRDVAQEVYLAGHGFRLGGQLFFASDVCSGCEAHALLAFNASLSRVRAADRSGRAEFVNCPVWEQEADAALV